MITKLWRVPVAAAVGYLAGTVPSADIATRLARTPRSRSGDETDGSTGERVTDLRQAGSGNPGATNAAAVLGRRWGLAVLVADIGKGALAGAVGRSLAGPAGAYAAATSAVAGHIVPVWNGGRGGKGVATSAGACLAVFPAYFPADAAVAAVGAIASRNAERAMRISSVAWVAAAVLWWRRRLPNAWGPEPTVGLPLFALTSSVMILVKFRAARRPA